MESRRREEVSHQSKLEEAKRNVERRIKSEVQHRIDADSEEILKRVAEEHKQRYSLYIFYLNNG